VPDVYKQLLRNCACCRAVRSGVGSRGSRAVLSRDEPGRKGETRLSPSKVFTIFPTLAVICLMMLAPSHTDAADKLGRYGVSRNTISVSDISSGGYMAQQYHVAHAKEIIGVGVIAAGPWDCANTQPGWLPLVTAANVCSHTVGDQAPFLGPPNLKASIAATKDAARDGQIDPTRFIASARAFLFSGTKDSLGLAEK
jgi:hypothetical protein